MITIENLSYRYRGGALALDGVNAAIGEGIHLLLGENGAGKTTLLHIMAGMLFPTRGACMVNGADPRLRLPLTLAGLFVLGDEMQFPAPTINSFKEMHARFYPTFSAGALEECLAAFDMTGNEPLAKMSLGTRKKAHLAYVLALKVPVLLLDEPANGIDINSRKVLRQLMARHIAPDQTVIVSTHSVVDFAPLYDGVMVLKRSRLLLSSPTSSILSRLTFVASPALPEGALYHEADLGQYRAIVPNETGREESEIDFSLLYSALMSPQGPRVLEILNTDRR